MAAVPALRPGEIHVWRVAIGDDAPAELLSEAERERAARFLVAHGRAAFATTRSALRELLGGYLGRDPVGLSLVADDHGRPALAGGELEFNVSHSGAVALVAVCPPGRRVGVDVEAVVDRTDLVGLAERFFAPAEASAVKSAPDGRAAFYACWTRKEALIKGVGQGLSLPLESFTVDPFAAGPAPVQGIDGWTVAPLGSPDGYAAALAWDGGPANVREGQWTS